MALPDLGGAAVPLTPVSYVYGQRCCQHTGI